MSHRNRAENRLHKARKDPRKLARSTKIHSVRTALDQQEDVLEQEMLEEIDEFFAEYMEPDPDDWMYIEGFKEEEEPWDR